MKPAGSSHDTAIAIGIDVGTSGVRAAAVNADGACLAFAQQHFETSEDARSPMRWLAGVRACLHDLTQQIPLATVQGVAVDGTSGTLLAVDANGAPVAGALMYNEPCPDRQILETISRHAPANSPALGTNSALARAIHLSRRPGVARILHQADWIALQLAPDHLATDENNALKTGYDLELEVWPDWIEAADMDRALLPEVHRAGDPLGLVGRTARDLGLPAHCRLHAGTTDGCAAFLATGANMIGDGVTSLGSTLVLKLASDKPLNVGRHGIYSHRIRDFWLVGGASNSGGGVIRALIGDDRLAELTGRLRPHEPTGLDYYPLIRPGERFPINDPELPPRLQPRPSDDAVYFQAILEGITRVEQLGYRRLQELGAPTLKTIRTVGGGSHNPAWTELRQQALGVTFLGSQSTEAAVGTASLALPLAARSS